MARFLVKVFQGAGYDEYLKSLRQAFAEGRGPQARRLPGRERRAILARPRAEGRPLKAEPRRPNFARVVRPSIPLIRQGLFDAEGYRA